MAYWHLHDARTATVSTATVHSEPGNSTPTPTSTWHSNYSTRLSISAGYSGPAAHHRNADTLVELFRKAMRPDIAGLGAAV